MALTSAVCQSLAAGTFVYVATQEVIAKEFARSSGASTRQRLAKFALLVAGVVLSALLKAYESSLEDAR